MNTGEKLRMLREIKKMSQNDVAKQIGVGRTTYLKYETGENRPVRKLEELSKLFGVSYDYLLDNDMEEIQWVKHGIKIPVLGTIVAGIPLEAVQEILDYEEIPAAMAKHGEYFALRVKGRSMEPNYIEGDTVIVRKEHTVDSGRVAVVLINGEEATLKKVKISPEGITLIGFNPVVYEPHYYSNKEIKELPVQIIGEVVELRRKV